MFKMWTKPRKATDLSRKLLLTEGRTIVKIYNRSAIDIFTINHSDVQSILKHFLQTAVRTKIFPTPPSSTVIKLQVPIKYRSRYVIETFVMLVIANLANVKYWVLGDCFSVRIRGESFLIFSRFYKVKRN